MRALVGVALVVGAAFVGGSMGSAAEPLAWLPGPQATDSFPHLEHQGLFPLCEGCHEGISAGDELRTFPEPALCAECHDGVEREQVEWARPAPVAGPLDFSHPHHGEEVEEAGEAPVNCAACHVDPAGRSMAVIPLDAGRCLECHGVPPSGHYSVGTDCAQCHRPLAMVDAGDDRFRSLPEPEQHGGRLFLLDVHGTEALDEVNRCATCHVEDQCAGCHVDASLQPIPQVPSAPAHWDVPLLRAEYPIPASHDVPSFERTHGRPSPEPADCSTCHTENDCAACHISPLPASAEALQERPQVRAPGVGLEDQLPSSHDSPFFVSTHPVLAATGPDACATCHTQSYCAECHDAPQAPGYHPPSFALRHSAAVGTQALECSNCHNAAAFCRECHADVGLQGIGRLGQGYHDAEPVWLIRHGGAARQGLEQCASCHTQKECMQCHSALGAFKVSPHGPDFDPVRAQEKNPWICRACHIGIIG
ncbi:MAG TPA: hypothetical protein VLA43_04850 [Longimicrobiales bacterium]|nr:hypothetical protein [Longimicrobiales bacterium]